MRSSMMTSGVKIRPEEGLPNSADQKRIQKAYAKFMKKEPKLKRGVDWEAYREAKKKFYNGVLF